MKNVLFVLVAATGLSGPALADKCGTDCGKVTTVEKFKKEGKGTGLGAIGGAVVGGVLGNQVGGGTGKTIATVGGAAGGAYVGHQVEKKVRSEEMLRVGVRMDNGKTASYELDDKAGFAVGDRVKIENGHPVRYTGK